MSIFKELNENMSLDEMKLILEQNSRSASTLKNKIALLDENAKKSSNFNYNYQIIENEEEDIDDDVEDEEEEFNYYYENIKEAIKECKTIDEVKEAIYDNLPVTDNKKYLNIVRGIILALVKEKQSFIEAFEGEDESTLEAVKEELDTFDFYIDTVRNHRSIEKSEIKKNHGIKNNLVFLTTLSGNIYAEQDLSSINPEYYAGFKGLLESIENGTFKNVKRFSQSHEILKGISEVKDFKIRVVFDRLDKNTYIILDIFVKKTQVDAGYQDHVARRVDYYKRNKEYFKTMLSDEVKESHGEIYSNIKDGLDNKNIVKTKKSGE